MIIGFDAEVFNGELTGVAKSTKFLYEACHELDSSFQAFGFARENLKKHNSGAIKMFQISSVDDIRRVIKDYNIKIIHYPNNGGHYWDIKGVENIITVHDVLPLHMPDFYGTMSRFAIRNFFLKYKYEIKKKVYKEKLQNSINKSGVVFTPSNYSKRMIEQFFNVNVPIYVLHWGSTIKNSNVLMEKGHFEKYGRYLVFFGGYSARKGISQLVNAFMKLYYEKRTNYNLILIGEKRALPEETEVQILEGCRANRIFETGYVTDNELYGIVRGADALLFLSKWEGYGMPVIEAMGLGVPVVTTRETSLPEVGGDAAIYVNPDNEEEVKNVIIKIENDRAYRKVMGEKGIERSKSFSWESCAETFLAVINRM